MKGHTLKTKTKLRKEFFTYLGEIEKLPIKKVFLTSTFPETQTKLDTLISTSVTKTLIIAEDLMGSILEKKFFTSLALIRMIFEETVLVTFALSKLEKSKTKESADHILTRIAVGLKSDLGRSDQLGPYNVHQTLEEAEKYISTQNSNLSGVFNGTYTFISEYVHPNAPSRFHFMKKHGGKTRIIIPITDKNDVNFLLNYACMSLGLYIFSMKRLSTIELRKE